MKTSNHPSDEVAQVRAALDRKKEDLEAAERELTARRRELFSFERRLENRLGRLIDKLDALENEIVRYEKIISEKRDERIYGEDHGFKDPRYWRNWQSTDPDQPAPQPIALPVDEEQLVKDLYRKLARVYHPDLAEDDDDVIYLERKMAELNEAHAAKNLAILKMLAIEAKIPPTPASQSSQKPKTELGQISFFLVLERISPQPLVLE